MALVARDTQTSSLAKRAWAEARKANDFSRFLPHLQALVDINREKAELWGYEKEPYDALLACFERGCSTARLTEEFDTLRPVLAEIAKAAVEHSQSRYRPLPAGPYPIAEQQAFNEKSPATSATHLLPGGSIPLRILSAPTSGRAMCG